MFRWQRAVPSWVQTVRLRELALSTGACVQPLDLCPVHQCTSAPAPSQMRSVVHQLQAQLALNSQELQALQSANEGLRVKCVTLRLLVRVLLEIQRHQQNMSGQQHQDDGHLSRLQSIIASSGLPQHRSFLDAPGGGRGAASIPESIACGWNGGSSWQGGAARGAADAGSSAGEGGLLEGVPHMGPGNNLLRLDG